MIKKYRKAVFIVIYRKGIGKEKNKIFYLILRRKLHWTGWEFPKGGVKLVSENNHEPDLMATKRECFEETGQKPEKVISFSFHGKYNYHKPLEDRPGLHGQTFKLFACELKSKKIKLDKKEHSTFRWLEFDKAVNLLTWPNQKTSLKIINNFLRKR